MEGSVDIMNVIHVVKLISYYLDTGFICNVGETSNETVTRRACAEAEFQTT